MTNWNKETIKRQIDYLNDIKFDEKKRNIYIPKKYFKNSKKGDIPLKMEILSRVKKSQLKNIKINVKTEKILPKSKITLVNNNDLETKASNRNEQSYGNSWQRQNYRNNTFQRIRINHIYRLAILPWPFKQDKTSFGRKRQRDSKT